ncbi:MAG: hypothetical protein M3P96_03865 [Actinomycetota bacterium]|nr:hypothetical protein [Actinomycetota bacterium]
MSAEVNGIQHRELLSSEYDGERQIELAIDGRTMASFSSYAVRRRPRQVADQMERLLRSRGWVSDAVVSRSAAS